MPTLRWKDCVSLVFLGGERPFEEIEPLLQLLEVRPQLWYFGIRRGDEWGAAFETLR